MKEEKEKSTSGKSRFRTIAYWVTTGIIVLETAAGVEWDFVRNPFVTNRITHLGYPLYIINILDFCPMLILILWRLFLKCLI